AQCSSALFHPSEHARHGHPDRPLQTLRVRTPRRRESAWLMTRRQFLLSDGCSTYNSNIRIYDGITDHEDRWAGAAGRTRRCAISALGFPAEAPDREGRVLARRTAAA